MGPGLQSERYASGDSRRRWPGASVGHVHRQDHSPMSIARSQGAQRRIPPRWAAPCDDLGGWDRPPVGFHNWPGGRSALRTSHRGRRDRRVQPRRTVDRVGRHGPHHPAMGSCEPERRRGPAWSYWRGHRSRVHSGRPPVGVGESVGKAELHVRWHSAALGSHPARRRVRAARAHQLHLSGRVQPGRTMDRLRRLGQHCALVGRSDRGELRDASPSRCGPSAGVQPG